MLYRHTRQDGGKMLHHALFGFLRVSLIAGCDKVVPEKLFRRRVFCYTPAIRSSVSVLHLLIGIELDFHVRHLFLD